MGYGKLEFVVDHRQDIADLKKRMDTLDKKMDAFIADVLAHFTTQDNLNAMIASRLEGLK